MKFLLFKGAQKGVVVSIFFLVKMKKRVFSFSAFVILFCICSLYSGKFFITNIK